MPTDYTDWPQEADITARLESAGVTPRASTGTRASECRLSVIAEIAQRTGRQFVPGETDEVRYFDGSGTASQDVDEMVTLSSVAVIGMEANPGYSLVDAKLAGAQGQPGSRLTIARGSLAAYSLLTVLPFQRTFPTGRQNIAVTGTFGFAASIPADLWEAAACEMALRLAAESIFTPSGRLTERRVGDEAEKYGLPEAQATGWHRQFERAVGPSPAGYKRPQGRRLRSLHAPMI